MELARNPSDDNIKNWIAYNDKKNELNRRLQERMEAYLKKNIKFTAKVTEIVRKRLRKNSLKFDPSRYRVRMFFDSQCPHCKKMFNTLAKLQGLGVFVEALQIDSRPLSSGYSLPVRKASKDEVKKYDIKSVPYTLVADLKKKIIYPPIQGFRKVQPLINFIKRGVL